VLQRQPGLWQIKHHRICTLVRHTHESPTRRPARIEALREVLPAHIPVLHRHEMPDAQLHELFGLVHKK